jgi:hypothetical protein
MIKRAERCAICHLNAPKRSCPHLACGACCLHNVTHAHKLKAAAMEEEKRAREKLQRARAAALASAHNKATGGASTVGVSLNTPVLALPSEVIDRVFMALQDDLASASNLACEHSTLLAAFWRTFHVVDTRSDLKGEIRPGAQLVVKAEVMVQLRRQAALRAGAGLDCVRKATLSDSFSLSDHADDDPSDRTWRWHREFEDMDRASSDSNSDYASESEQ